MALWVLRVLFLTLAVLGGYAISQVQPDLIPSGVQGVAIGFGFGGLMIAIDEMLKGFSLRAFSAATFGLVLGTIIAWLIDRSQLFYYADQRQQWLIRLCLFVSFSYIGMILAMRSNKEDFSLIIPFVRFSSQNKPDDLLLMDTSAIIDGRIADLTESSFLEGVIVVPRFVLREIHQLADSLDPLKRARGRRGLEILGRIQRNTRNEFKIHEGDFPEEVGADAKLVRLAKALGAKLFTTDYNLARIAELQSVRCVNLSEVANSLRTVIIPGEVLSVRLVREGKDRGQGVGYLADGTMVVVNQGQSLIGQQVEAQVLTIHQTGSGVIVFAEVRPPVAA